MNTTLLLLTAALCVLASVLLSPAQGQVISEFMASNEDTLTLADGDSPDWIEIHNPGTTTIDLSGWHLTDRIDLPTRWPFPAGTSLAPGAFLLVYATGQNLNDPASALHTNFGLSEIGEYLALTSPAGFVQQEFAPAFPEQFCDISFGLATGQTSPGYFTSPTPGAANNASVLGFIKDTKFSVNRGFFDTPFAVEVTTATPGASIYYTLDGSDPDLSSTHVDAPDQATPPSLVLDISNTTIVRAFAAKPGHVPTDIDTHSYLFPDQIIAHPKMSTQITNNPIWGPQMRDALLEIPSISLITQKEIPDQTPSIENPEEIPVSIEMIFPDGREGFQANAGVERFGGQYSLFEKKNLRVSFKEIYGPKKLKFDLFSDTPYGGDSAVDTFDQLILRNGSHDAIFHEGYPRPRNGAFVRNRYYFDRQLEMGHPSLRGKFVHVYLNGIYYGHYHLMERPNADYMATQFGGEEEDYDVMKGRSGISAEQGNQTAWNAMVANAGNFQNIQNYMDVDNYIDYMLLNFYGGNDHDWYPQHNWVAARKREEGATFKFFMWDSDFLNRRLPTVNTTDNGGPANMFNSLKNNAEFKIRMADRAQKHFFNGGMLTKARVEADFNELGNSLSRTIIPETARWGNSNSSFYTPTTFANAIGWLATGFSATRTETVIQQMQAVGVFPNTLAPSFSQHGGEVPAGFPLQITHDLGNLYYTTDGSDPRLPGGAVNPSAIAVGGPSFATVTIPASSDWKYEDSGTDFGDRWRSTSFNDAAWSTGSAPLGFGSITNTPIATTVFNGLSRQLTFYCRKSFEITDVNTIVGAALNIHSDGGSVVYLNGVEIVRDNMPEGPITRLTGSTDDGIEGIFDPYEFDHTLLLEGTNLITVEVHNRTVGSNDMVFDLELTHDRLNPNAVATIGETSGIKTRVLNGTEWSALNEATFITDEAASSGNLVISEIHYHPSDTQNGEAEFIELMNISNTRISLSGVSFTEGISSKFGGRDTLAPRQRLVLVFDPIAFATTYGAGVSISGTYTSRLANDGERITLVAADGSIIQTLRYNDKAPWPTSADGTGYSLVLVAPVAQPDHEGPQNWRSSKEPGGTPGSSDSSPYLGSTDLELMQYATGETASGEIHYLDGQAILKHFRVHGADDASITGEVSSDMKNWTTSGVEFRSQENQLNDRAKIRWTLPNAAIGQPLFARIVVTLHP
ncbi:MAG: lamin tail domain-containing protein [Akkermansiaceae bacterium]